MDAGFGSFFLPGLVFGSPLLPDSALGSEEETGGKKQEGPGEVAVKTIQQSVDKPPQMRNGIQKRNWKKRKITPYQQFLNGCKNDPDYKPLNSRAKYEKARKSYESSAKKRCCQALVRLGEFWENGLGNCQKDTDKAADFYNQAADLGSPEGHLHLGILHIKGLLNGTPNPEKAICCFETAIKVGFCPDAHALLGHAYLIGEGVQQNEVEACAHLQVAAAWSHADSQLNLGLLFERRGGYVTAANLYELARNNPQNAHKELAQYSLVKLYLEGHISGRSEEFIFHLLEESAEKLVNAKLALASVYAHGALGQNRDIEKVFAVLERIDDIDIRKQFFTTLKEKADQLNDGLLYFIAAKGFEKGYGDRNDSLKYYKYAAINGIQEALAYIDDLCDKAEALFKSNDKRKQKEGLEILQNIRNRRAVEILCRHISRNFDYTQTT